MFLQQRYSFNLLWLIRPFVGLKIGGATLGMSPNSAINSENCVNCPALTSIAKLRKEKRAVSQDLFIEEV